MPINPTINTTVDVNVSLGQAVLTDLTKALAQKIEEAAKMSSLTAAKTGLKLTPQLDEQAFKAELAALAGRIQQMSQNSFKLPGGGKVKVDLFDKSGIIQADKLASFIRALSIDFKGLGIDWEKLQAKLSGASKAEFVEFSKQLKQGSKSLAEAYRAYLAPLNKLHLALSTLPAEAHKYLDVLKSGGKLTSEQAADALKLAAAYKDAAAALAKLSTGQIGKILGKEILPVSVITDVTKIQKELADNARELFKAASPFTLAAQQRKAREEADRLYIKPSAQARVALGEAKLTSGIVAKDPEQVEKLAASLKTLQAAQKEIGKTIEETRTARRLDKEQTDAQVAAVAKLLDLQRRLEVAVAKVKQQQAEINAAVRPTAQDTAFAKADKTFNEKVLLADAAQRRFEKEKTQEAADAYKRAIEAKLQAEGKWTAAKQAQAGQAVRLSDDYLAKQKQERDAVTQKIALLLQLTEAEKRAALGREYVGRQVRADYASLPAKEQEAAFRAGVPLASQLPTHELDAALVALKEEYKRVKTAQAELAATINQATGKPLGAGSPQVRAMGKELHELDVQIQHLTWQTKGLTSAWHQMELAFKAFIRYGVLYQVFYAATNAIRSFITDTIDLQKNLKAIQAVAGVTAHEMSGVASSIKEVATSTEFAAPDLAQAALVLAQAGVGVEKLPGYLKAVAEFASASGTAISTAADLVTSIGAVYSNLTPKEISDQLTAAVNLSKLTGQDIQSILTRAVQTGKELGVTFAQTLATVGVLRNQGISAQTISTGYRQMLLEIMSPDSRMTAFLVDRYKELGDKTATAFSVKQKFAAFQFEKNPLVSAGQELQRLGLGGTAAISFRRTVDIRAENILTPVIKGLDQIVRLEQEVQQVNVAAKGASVQMESLANASTNLVQVFKVTFYEAMEGFVTSLTTATKDIASWAKGLRIFQSESQAKGEGGTGVSAQAGVIAGVVSQLFLKGGWKVSIPVALLTGLVDSLGSALGGVWGKVASVGAQILPVFIILKGLFGSTVAAISPMAAAMAGGAARAVPALAVMTAGLSKATAFLFGLPGILIGFSLAAIYAGAKRAGFFKNKEEQAAGERNLLAQKQEEFNKSEADLVDAASARRELLSLSRELAKVAQAKRELFGELTGAAADAYKLLASGKKDIGAKGEVTEFKQNFDRLNTLLGDKLKDQEQAVAKIATEETNVIQRATAMLKNAVADVAKDTTGSARVEALRMALAALYDKTENAIGKSITSFEEAAKFINTYDSKLELYGKAMKEALAKIRKEILAQIAKVAKLEFIAAAETEEGLREQKAKAHALALNPTEENIVALKAMHEAAEEVKKTADELAARKSKAKSMAEESTFARGFIFKLPETTAGTYEDPLTKAKDDTAKSIDALAKGIDAGATQLKDTLESTYNEKLKNALMAAAQGHTVAYANTPTAKAAQVAFEQVLGDITKDMYNAPDFAKGAADIEKAMEAYTQALGSAADEQKSLDEAKKAALRSDLELKVLEINEAKAALKSAGATGATAAELVRLQQNLSKLISERIAIQQAITADELMVKGLTKEEAEKRAAKMAGQELATENEERRSQLDVLLKSRADRLTKMEQSASRQETALQQSTQRLADARQRLATALADQYENEQFFKNIRREMSGRPTSRRDVDELTDLAKQQAGVGDLKGAVTTAKSAASMAKGLPGAARMIDDIETLVEGFQQGLIDIESEKVQNAEAQALRQEAAMGALQTSLDYLRSEIEALRLQLAKGGIEANKGNETGLGMTKGQNNTDITDMTGQPPPPPAEDATPNPPPDVASGSLGPAKRSSGGVKGAASNINASSSGAKGAAKAVANINAASVNNLAAGKLSASTSFSDFGKMGHIGDILARLASKADNRWPAMLNFHFPGGNTMRTLADMTPTAISELQLWALKYGNSNGNRQ